MPRRDPFEVNPLEVELLEEKAATYARILNAMRAALNDLEAFDLDAPAPSDRSLEQRQRRAELLALASERAWFFVVQRDALGMGRPEGFYEEFGISPEVRRHMGPRLRR
jgi:hypothetical protein